MSDPINPTRVGVPRRLPTRATLQQAASYLGVHPKTIRNYIAKGFFPGYRMPGGKGIRVDLNEVERAIQLLPATVTRLGTNFGPKANIIMDAPRTEGDQ